MLEVDLLLVLRAPPRGALAAQPTAALQKT